MTPPVARESRRRPDPLRWIWYAMRGSCSALPRVLRDLTSQPLDQVVRAAVQVVPPAVVLLLTLGTVWITWVGAICGLLALIYSVVYLDQSADYRLVKHGFPRAHCTGLSMSVNRRAS
jgi:hypothetical protein